MQLSLEAGQTQVAQMQLSLEAEQTWQDRKFLNLGITNLLTKFIEILHETLDMKLPGGGENIPHSTQRYKTAAANLKSLKPEKFTTATRGLPIKYLGIVNQYSKVNKLLHKTSLWLASDKQIVS